MSLIREPAQQMQLMPPQSKCRVRSGIGYERKNSPVSQSSSAGIWADVRVGTLNIRDSRNAMEQERAWQAYDAIAAPSGITVDDFVVAIFGARCSSAIR